MKLSLRKEKNLKSCDTALLSVELQYSLQDELYVQYVQYILVHILSINIFL